jgi:5-keto 4-deoxyuronate isomerase
MSQKAFVTKSGKANFKCPECNKVKQMDVSRYTDIDKEVKLKCTCACKHVFSVLLERRRHIRKNVALEGQLFCEGQQSLIMVVDVSRIGLRLKTSKKLKLNVGSKAVVKFTLDDVHRSMVSKEVVIKSVSDRSVGVEFLSYDHYDKFGNYILFKTS